MGPRIDNGGPNQPPLQCLMLHQAAPASPASYGTVAGGELQEQMEVQTASKRRGKIPQTNRYGGAHEGARCRSDQTLRSAGYPLARRALCNVSHALGLWKRRGFALAFALMYCIWARVSIANYALSDDKEHDTSQNGISMILTSSRLNIDLELIIDAF